MRIPESVSNQGPWPISEVNRARYSLPTSEVNPYQLVLETGKQFDTSVVRKYNDAMKSQFWSDEKPNLREYCMQERPFEPLTGAIYLPSDIPDLKIADFFKVPTRVYNRAGRIQNRSKNYYVSVDPDFGTSERKLDLIKTDIVEGMDATSAFIREEASIEATLGYLGVLDYLKQHYLTLFNILTYPERFGERDMTSEYEDYRAMAEQLAVEFTRRFYQTIIGSDHQRIETDVVLSDTDNLVKYIKDLSREPQQYTLQECDHPAKLLSHTHSLLEAHPETNSIIAIANGGNQAGILMQVGLQDMHNTSISLNFVPLSLHAARMGYGRTLSEKELLIFLDDNSQDLHGKHILVTEDNVNSGNTAQMMTDSLKKFSPASVAIGIVEIDPYRVIYKQDQSRVGTFGQVANFLHPDFKHAVGYLPISNDYQIRKKYIWRLFNSFK